MRYSSYGAQRREFCDYVPGMAQRQASAKHESTRTKMTKITGAEALRPRGSPLDHRLEPLLPPLFVLLLASEVKAAVLQARRKSAVNALAKVADRANAQPTIYHPVHQGDREEAKNALQMPDQKHDQEDDHR